MPCSGKNAKHQILEAAVHYVHTVLSGLPVHNLFTHGWTQMNTDFYRVVFVTTEHAEYTEICLMCKVCHERLSHRLHADV